MEDDDKELFVAIVKEKNRPSLSEKIRVIRVISGKVLVRF
jgi:hypothetical protein